MARCIPTTGINAGGRPRCQRQKPSQTEREHDKTLEDTFPASDAPANSGITGAEPPETTSTDPIPTGTPTSDRHGAETAHQGEGDKTGLHDSTP